MRLSSVRDLLRLGELRAQRVEQHRGGHAADREPGRPVEEAAAVDVAVHVGVEQIEQLLVEVVGGLSLHGVLLRETKLEQGSLEYPRPSRCRQQLPLGVVNLLEYGSAGCEGGQIQSGAGSVLVLGGWAAGRRIAVIGLVMLGWKLRGAAKGV